MNRYLRISLIVTLLALALAWPARTVSPPTIPVLLAGNCQGGPISGG